MSTPFENKRILLGVTGSIAAYKAADLASKLTQIGAAVDVIMTQSALQFVTPLTFQSVTGRKAYTDVDLWGSEGHVLHIGLARNADLLVIAPATANTIARIAHGIGDNLLTVTVLAASCPLLIAPAMDGGMYLHAATQSNIRIIQQRGVVLIGPSEGHLASGLSGIGRLIEPVDILGQIRYELSRNGILTDKKIIVTAGGTQESIDPVRLIVNRSSGKQGYAIAQAALDRGAKVTLISAPTTLPTPAGAKKIDVITADEMLEAVLQTIPDSDALIMSAAVADFKPMTSFSQKLKRTAGQVEIHLESTPDILKTVAELKSKTGYPKIVVGFAAESHDLKENARLKLQNKSLDLIVANDITASDAGFIVDTNRVTILDAGGGEEVLPLMTKYEIADILLERIVALLTVG
jgi:phosphopantothenoylcysteine decarboxylase/phosphopantothenate--cysteine ligase